MYIIIPMLEDMQIGNEREVTYEEMLELVYDYNYGKLGHCDAWFELYSVDSEGNVTKLELSDYFASAEKHRLSKHKR